MQIALNNVPTKSFSMLLARYLQGQIDENTWGKIMKTIDQQGISSVERKAYTRFLSELYAPRQAA